MKYLVVGAGGTGGLLAGYLAKKNYDVTIVARGNHLQAIQQKGLLMHTYDRQSFLIKNINAVSQEALKNETFDVIFLCVKAYNINDVIPLLKQVAHENTVIIPILNSMRTGSLLRVALNKGIICDGCIYITGYISAPGEITQNNKIFRVVYGLPETEETGYSVFAKINETLMDSGINALYSKDILSEIFKKLCFTSAFASVGAYYDVEANLLQQEGVYRNLFITLLTELKAIAAEAQLKISTDIVESNLTILDQLSADFTASMQKDLKQGKPDEREELIFDIVRMAEKYRVAVPNYYKIAKHFGYRN